MTENEGTKQCPMCAEQVQAAARLCRFCGYRFDLAEAEGGTPETAQPPGASPPPPAPPPQQYAPPTPPPQPSQYTAAAAPPPRKRSRAQLILLVVAICLLAIAALAYVTGMTRKSLDEREMAYVARYIQEDYKDAEYFMLGTAMAAQRSSAELQGRRLTAASLTKARRLFREADRYFRKLQAVDSPSALFDETHDAWQKEIGLERRCLAALKTWFEDPWSDKGRAASSQVSRLADRAEEAGDTSWGLFKAVMSAEASSDQVAEVSRLQAKYKAEMKEE